MRKNHGSDWLLALQDPYTTTPSVNTTEPVVTNQYDSTEPSQDPSGSETEQVTEVEVHRSDSVQEHNTEQVSGYKFKRKFTNCVSYTFVGVVLMSCVIIYLCSS